MANRIGIPLAKPDINRSDVEAVCQVLGGDQLALGPSEDTSEVELARCGRTAHAVVVNSGRARYISSSVLWALAQTFFLGSLSGREPLLEQGQL